MFLLSFSENILSYLAKVKKKMKGKTLSTNKHALLKWERHQHPRALKPVLIEER